MKFVVRLQAVEIKLGLNVDETQTCLIKKHKYYLQIGVEIGHGVLIGLERLILQILYVILGCAFCD